MGREIENRVMGLLDGSPTGVFNRQIFDGLSSMVDYTDLSDDLWRDDVPALVARALKGSVAPAAICTHPHLIPTLKSELIRVGSHISTCSVTGSFPSGNQDPASLAGEVSELVQVGAEEIDIVAPYETLLETGGVEAIVKATSLCAEAAQSSLLKVIIESGQLEDLDLIYRAARAAAENGADFVKTSSGRTAEGASEAHVAAIALAVLDSGDLVGIKVSGGVSSPAFALRLNQIVVTALGEAWNDQALFRIGSSSFGGSNSGSSY